MQVNLQFKPPKIDNGIARIDETTDGTLNALLTAVEDGILAVGDVKVKVNANCAKCLADLEIALVADINAFYEYPYKKSSKNVTDDSIDDDVYEIVGNEINFEQAVLDALTVELPYKPICYKKCLHSISKYAKLKGVLVDSSMDDNAVSLEDDLQDGKVFALDGTYAVKSPKDERWQALEDLVFVAEGKQRAGRKNGST
jgi:uncharacterized metal-binding protein YceD (DUF177 family)